MLPSRSAEVDRALGIVPSGDWREDWLIESAEFTGPWTIRVVFFDGTTGEVDIEELVNSPRAGVFAALRDPEVYKQACLCFGALTWPGELDLAPDAMYEDIKKSGRSIIRASRNG